MQIIKKPLIVRIISVIIVALFLCQNIAFCASEKISTLRPLSLFDESNENNTDDLPDSTETQPVYFFGVDLRGNNLTEGNSGMNDLLGGKGANLAQMCRITYKFDGKEYFIKVPSGFTITTEESKLYFDNGNQLRKELIEAIDNNLAKLENATGRKFGDKDKPLIVSIRSGAPASMPGMLATVLNIGLNDETVEALAKELDNPRSAWDSYRRLIMMFGDSALGLGPFKFNEIWGRAR